MGVINEYFVAASDAEAAQALEDGPTAGVIGPEPNTELVALEAILLGLDPDSAEAVDLVSRADHAVDVAADSTYDRMVIKIASATTELIGTKTFDELRTHVQRWAQTEEMAAYAVPDLHDLIAVLHPLFTVAAAQDDCDVYVWTSL
ncbi:hypothetical protein FZI85_27260 [Mycobacterium sp. CBMA293]|uniref:hypothetical protein n=1 Tax=unclassified Mycolicibacterium TaxID=2636767 RepID=UPI0012DF0D58|nr:MULTISPECIES: hypothetical protein [unclassified Mycolicibacterium]MUL48447.1 hypothetical protein [Mycolicibacterium sp. CBMA 360]MUL62305.1 hypothetical protein [Mycolicibacterium sp. CBMA 335]MUM04442.1 hypothetical protein [Mycolicibacterium sp. CBMA 213]MUM14705.1 hypothetical protein [Mycolicibacterium sp. CBMA 293]